MCKKMKAAKFFTEEERVRVEQVQRELFALAADVIREGDEEKLSKYLDRTQEQGLLQHDAFGLNPIVKDTETALIVAEEIGLSRGSVLSVLLWSVVKSGAASLDEIRGDFGEEVAHILHGLMRIREVYAKSATVGSENFRSLLVTFAEDMRVILIMIANRVCVMRQIKDNDNVEAQRKVSMEAYPYDTKRKSWIVSIRISRLIGIHSSVVLHVIS